MSACQSSTHGLPEYAKLHNQGEATHYLYRYCPECAISDEMMVCSTYADTMLDQVIQNPYRRVNCPRCSASIHIEDHIEDILPLPEEGKVQQMEQLLSGIFQETLPCEAPSHADPKTKAYHTVGGNGEYYLFGSCDACGLKHTSLYCTTYTEGILAERALYPHEKITCPRCKTGSTALIWFKSVTTRATGITQNL